VLFNWSIKVYCLWAARVFQHLPIRDKWIGLQVGWGLDCNGRHDCSALGRCNRVTLQQLWRLVNGQWVAWVLAFCSDV